MKSLQSTFHYYFFSEIWEINIQGCGIKVIQMFLYHKCVIFVVLMFLWVFYFKFVKNPDIYTFTERSTKYGTNTFKNCLGKKKLSITIFKKKIAVLDITNIYSKSIFQNRLNHSYQKLFILVNPVKKV